MNLPAVAKCELWVVKVMVTIRHDRLAQEFFSHICPSSIFALSLLPSRYSLEQYSTFQSPLPVECRRFLSGGADSFGGADTSVADETRIVI